MGFIAGSYTPWLNLRQLDGASVELRWAVWLLATLGILYQQIFHERYKALETTFYVVIALLPSLAVYEMVTWHKTHLEAFISCYQSTSLIIFHLTKKFLCLKETQCRVRNPVCAVLKLFSQ